MDLKLHQMGKVMKVILEFKNLNSEEQLVTSVATDKINDSELDTVMMLNAKLNIPKITKRNAIQIQLFGTYLYPWKQNRKSI